MSQGGRRWLGVLRGVVSVGLAVVLIVVALPRVTRTEWSGIGAVLSNLTVADVGLLGFVWICGLLAYTYVLTAVLPGLGHGQALVLNVTGSAVSNVVPFGGAVGVAVTWGIARSWGFSGTVFALGTLIAGVVNVLAKLVLPMLGLLALIVAGELADGRLVVGAGIAAGLLAATLVLLAAVLSSGRVAVWAGRSAQRVVGALVGGWNAVLRMVERGADRAATGRHARRGGGALGAPDGPTGTTVPAPAADAVLDWGDQLLDLRARTVVLLRRRWPQILLGLGGFYGSQALLQWIVLAQLGTTLSIAQVFAGYCFGRLLSSVVVTPGGVGIAETGAAGLLVALGGDPAVTASGVLLFSLFAFVLEIPAGAVGYLVWQWRPGWRSPAAPQD